MPESPAKARLGLTGATRLRRSLFGKMILQVEVTESGMWPHERRWKDATDDDVWALGKMMEARRS